MNDTIARIGFAIVWLYCSHYVLKGLGRLYFRIASVFRKS